MLLPDNIHPERSIYYNGALVLQAIQEHGVLELLDLYKDVQSRKEISMPVFVLSLDWLFLLGLVNLTEQGFVELCS